MSRRFSTGEAFEQAVGDFFGHPRCTPIEKAPPSPLAGGLTDTLHQVGPAADVSHAKDVNQLAVQV
jgi:hypothetical protein